MNYSRIYNELVTRGQTRVTSSHEYYERHHIVPRCMNGDDSSLNISLLTPEEHYLAHQLLVKIYPKNQKLMKAAIRMTSGKRRNNKLYGWLKRVYSISMIGSGNTFFGRTHTDETKEKIRNAILGKTRRVETKTKISQSRLGKVWSDESKDRLSVKRKGCKGIIHTVESKDKISQSRLSSNKVFRVKIQTPAGVFGTIKSAAEFYNIDPGTVKYRCDHIDGWSRLAP